MRRRLLAAAVAAAVVAGGGVIAALALAQSGAADAPPTSAPPAATAEITKGDLVDTKDVDGTLGYADRRALPNRARGTITRTRGDGAVVRRGGKLYTVDAKPVVLMYGDAPMYRTLSNGSEGADVKRLEANLDRLGYSVGTVDDEYTWRTREAVEAWQDDVGLPETGTVSPAEVAFAPGPLRIASSADTGTQAGGSVVTVTATKRQVHVDLSASDQQLARLGASVTVEAPGGATTKGRIVEIGTVAQAAREDGGQSTIDLEIALSAKLGRLDQAPVTVSLRSRTRKNVLSVPVEALLALREGGYGVRLVPGGIVAVEPGLYASGRVEVTGAGVAEGVRVEVPAQ